MANDAVLPRLRLEFTKAVLPRIGGGGRNAIHRCWFQMPRGLATIEELAGAIIEEFSLGVGGAAELQMVMDGFALLPGSAVSLIRDGDLVKVQRAPSQRPPRQATVGKRQPPVSAAGKPALALLGPPAAGGNQPSRKRKAAAPAPQARPAKKPAAAAAVAAPAQSSSYSDEETSEESSSEEESSEASSSEEDSSSSEEEEEGQPAAAPAVAAAAAPKKPSRNARRKAVKRRLRREGVLPGGSRPAGRAAAQAAAVKPPAAQGVVSGVAPPVAGVSPPATAAKAPDAAVVPKPQLPLPPPAGRQQPRRGHIQFSDSDAEEATRERPATTAASVPAAGMPPSTAQRQDGFRHGDAGYNSQPWDYSRQQQRKQKRAGQRHTASAIALRSPQADDRLGPLPLVDEHRLQPLTGLPLVGDVLSYRLLEIGEDFSPQVSARRQGKVTMFDADSRQVTMEPWPRSSIHPVWAERAQAAGIDYFDYTDALEEGGEEPPIEYDADGSLTISYDSLADVAAITVTVSFDSPAAQRSPAPAAAPAAAMPAQAPPQSQQNGVRASGSGLRTPKSGVRQPNDSGPAAVAAAAAAALPSPPPRVDAPAMGGDAWRLRAQSEGRPLAAATPPYHGSGLGPPRPSSTGPLPRPAAGRAVPTLSQWADASRQLQRRRAELAAATHGGPSTPPASGNTPAPSPAAAATAEGQALQSPAAGLPAALAAAGGGTSGGVREQSTPKQAPGAGGLPGRMTAGPARPHGGVRSSAMGAILRRLRSESEPVPNGVQL